MDNFIERLVAVLLCLFLFLYTGYQFTRNKEAPYVTEAALNYTIADSIKCGGLIIRQEQVIDNNSANGVVRYKYSDGAMVSRFTTIAEVYSNENDIVLQKKIRSLETEMQGLEKVSDKRSLEYSNTDRISEQVDKTIDEIISISASRKVYAVSEKREKLALLLNQKAVATGVAENFDDRLATVNSEISKLKSKLSGNYNEYKSPISGYFARTTDGKESQLNFETMETMSAADFEKLAYENIAPNNNSFGKIITDHNWYYAAVMTKKESEKFQVGDTVFLDFSVYNLTDIPFDVTEIKTDLTTDKYVVLLKTNYIVPQLLQVRNPSAHIKFKSYTGLKISPSAKRYDGQQSGVYVYENNMVKFKTINIIYETDTYILCGANTDTKRPLQLYDLVIVEGTDLKDGTNPKTQ